MTTHPLQCPFSFYYLQDNSVYHNAEFVKPFAVVNTVEEFWAVYSHTKNISDISIGEIHVFRNSARAMCEDEVHKNGGAFQITFTKPEINQKWEYLLLELIGSKELEKVIGVIVKQVVNSYRVRIWVTEMDINERLKICHYLYTSLGVQSSRTFMFKNHFSNETIKMTKDGIIVS